MKVQPNCQQFFTGQCVHLSCEEEEEEGNSTGWTLKRISVEQTETCGAAEGFGRINGSTCIVSDLSPRADRGVYWCEHQSGQKSLQVTLTVSDRPFIMEIPALPVMEGSDVTLLCRSKNGSPIPAHFFKFGRHGAPIQAAPEGEFVIKKVRQSDEGFYWCSTGQNTSPSSRLNVVASSSTTSSPTLLPAPFPVRLFCHLVVIIPYCIVTGLMVCIYCSRRTGSPPAVTMEMAQQDEPERALDECGVTTLHDF
ncbi:uncharacterized protein LOC115796663 [Archocentrus centrarchus]|uniref:uncharacterized protein LOC115796663 n=1 Tax=Archocentrus centrarchus TaxID=63155 RepID=UPI0011E9F5BC|nr:uncharacterized protein LOC115796663 [Archocentrus centrarchus]